MSASINGHGNIFMRLEEALKFAKGDIALKNAWSDVDKAAKDQRISPTDLQILEGDYPRPDSAMR